MSLLSFNSRVSVSFTEQAFFLISAPVLSSLGIFAIPRCLFSRSSPGSKNATPFLRSRLASFLFTVSFPHRKERFTPFVVLFPPPPCRARRIQSGQLFQ